jgi:hypothetical protein
MSRAMEKEPIKEKNNFREGKSGSETTKLPGPAKGGGDRSRNKTNSGGINRATKSNGQGD